jgi:hypothetical protein
MDIAKQLEIFGLEETMRLAAAQTRTPQERGRLTRRIETTHDILSAFPEPDELSFLHSGLCQTCLPHSRPAQNQTIWRRTSGRFTLSISPGSVARAGDTSGEDGYVGVPYGSKARLILIHLISNRPGWCRLVGCFRHVTGAKSGSIYRRQRGLLFC